MDIQKLAELVDTAANKAKPIEQLSKQHAFTEYDAYAIQAASIERRYGRGETFIGVKMGFTSKAKMEQMGVHDMIWGRLTDSMLYKDGDTMPFNKFIHPRAEPELCFLVKKTIDKELEPVELKDYIAAVAPAIEVIDSRYENFKFSLEDVIADNCSSAGLVIGNWSSKNYELHNLKMELLIDGEVVQDGWSSAILGNPWDSVINASRLATYYELEIPEGCVIMAGAATPAVFLAKGQEVSVRVEDLGEAGFKVG